MLLRCFVGGSNVSQWRDANDSQLIEMVNSELSQLIGFEPGDQTKFDVMRWLDCMPQYRVGHLQLVEQIKNAVGDHNGLSIAGASYDGVGIPACIASGKQAAEDVLAQL